MSDKLLIQALEENSHIIATFKDFMKNHDKPSTETRIKLENIEKDIKGIEERSENNNKEILNAIKEMQAAQNKWMEGIEKKIDGVVERVRVIEDWKLVFTTKMTIYWSIAFLLGTAIGQLILSLFKNIIS